MRRLRHLRRNPELRPSPWGKNLAGMDLSEQDLSDMDLRGVDLRRANLGGTDLTAADLTGANLTEANLAGASIEEARLVGANLAGANLRAAFCSAADLASANLSRANLTLADLSHANLTGANLDGADLTDADFTHAQVAGLSLVGTDYKRAPTLRPFGSAPEYMKFEAPTSGAFKRWFGDSVVVSDEGKPVVVYHGTRTGGFTQLDPAKRDAHHNAFYFTDSLATASTYAEEKGTQHHVDPAAVPGTTAGVYRLYIRLINPMIVEGDGREWYDLSHPRAPASLTKTFELAKWAQAHGHDGVIFKNILDGGGGTYRAPPATVYAVFDPRAIKSATANNGNFDPNDPDIRHNPRRPRPSRGARRR